MRIVSKVLAREKRPPVARAALLHSFFPKWRCETKLTYFCSDVCLFFSSKRIIKNLIIGINRVSKMTTKSSPIRNEKKKIWIKCEKKFSVFAYIRVFYVIVKSETPIPCGLKKIKKKCFTTESQVNSKDLFFLVSIPRFFERSKSLNVIYTYIRT